MVEVDDIDFQLVHDLGKSEIIRDHEIVMPTVFIMAQSVTPHLAKY